jgi:hypothetical protein
MESSNKKTPKNVLPIFGKKGVNQHDLYQQRKKILHPLKELDKCAFIASDKGRWSWRGAKRRGNLIKLLPCLRNGPGLDSPQWYPDRISEASILYLRHRDFYLTGRG